MEYYMPDGVRLERHELLLKILEGRATKEDRKKYEEIDKKYAQQLRDEAIFQAMFD